MSGTHVNRGISLISADAVSPHLAKLSPTTGTWKHNKRRRRRQAPQEEARPAELARDNAMVEIANSRARPFPRRISRGGGGEEVSRKKKK